MADLALILVPPLLVGSLWGAFVLRRFFERKYGTAWRPTVQALTLYARNGWEEGRAHWLHQRAMPVPTVEDIIRRGVVPGAVEAWLVGWKAGTCGKSLDVVPSLMAPHLRRWAGGK